MTKSVMVLLLIGILIFPRPSHADSSKEFLTSVIYGTVAGTLVGVATLAFTANPGDNLMNIARGASLGLYAGIILGTYLIYGTDDSDTPSGTINPERINPESVPSSDSGAFHYQKSKQDPLHGFAIYPITQNNSVGVGANLFTFKF